MVAVIDSSWDPVGGAFVWTFLGGGRPLLGSDVALKVEAHRDALAVLHRLPTPDALIVLAQLAHIGEAIRLDARLRLPLGKAVRTCDGRSWVRRSVRGVDGRRVGITIRRLRDGSAGHHCGGGRDRKICTHFTFPLWVWTLPNSFNGEMFRAGLLLLMIAKAGITKP